MSQVDDGAADGGPAPLSKLVMVGEGAVRRFDGPHLETKAQRFLETRPVYLEATFQLGEQACEFALHVDAYGPPYTVRRCLAIALLCRYGNSDRHEGNRLLGLLAGPSLRIPFGFERLTTYQSPLNACPCGRRVPWVRAILGTHLVHVLQPHHSGLAPCAVNHEALNLLDRVAPWPIGARPQRRSSALMEAAYWQACQLLEAGPQT